MSEDFDRMPLQQLQQLRDRVKELAAECYALAKKQRQAAQALNRRQQTQQQQGEAARQEKRNAVNAKRQELAALEAAK